MVEKYILTGGPGSGKSSVNLELEIIYGIRKIDEAAEDIITFHKKRGNETPWQLPDFQDQILKLQLQREKEIETLEGRVSIDRGIIDQLAYYQINGMNYSQTLQEALKNHKGYTKVFLLEAGNKIEQNGIRRENLEEALIHQRLHFENYMKAGYKVNPIPWLESPKERAEMIIKMIGERK